MNQESKNHHPRLQFLTCPDCQGQGIINDKKCEQCDGFFLRAWTGQELLYWGEPISATTIARHKLVLFIKNLINITLFLFGALGLVMLVWQLVIYTTNHLPISVFYRYHSWQLVIFWFSLLTDTYLYYRFQRDIEKIRHIPKKSYELKPTAFDQLSWEQAKRLPRGKQIDIAKYFTFEARQIVNRSWELAAKYKDQAVFPIHLLISLLIDQQIQIIFSRLGVPFTTLKNKIRSILGRQPAGGTMPVIFGELAEKIIFESYFLSYQLRQKKVEVTEILEALASQENDVKELLYDLDIDSDKISNVIAWLRIKKQLRANWQKFRQRASLKPSSTMNRSMTAIATPVLDAFSQDMTLLAQAGYLMPCIGREKEIDDILSIMHGGTRRSVILVGNPGVGKNTIVEGIVQRMVEEDVPEFLQDKRLVSLSVAKLVSGATPAEAQERLMFALNEIRRSGNIVLYIGDIHNMVGITSGRPGSIDLADVLAKTLAANTILVIATSTPGDYRRYVEGRSSLDDVLEKIEIQEVSGNEAIQIVESKVGAFEYQNQVYFSYDAVAQTVLLSDRYLHDRFLPEKAIEVLQEVATTVRNQKGKNSVVNENDVAAIISQKTNIPLTEITKEESEKLLNLEEKIHQRVVDQVEAVEMVASSLRRARAEMRDLSRPIVNLLFLGPTGVGKTELAKTVAEVYFGDQENMIRLDMSEYQDKTSLNRLIGAPPGYGEEGGFLSEAVRKNPFSLILLDEIEKAHPDILNIFLQIMEDGRLTDNNGRTVDFTNAIIIATSNAASTFIQEQIRNGTSVEQTKQQLMDRELNQYFRPEFLNRFDGVIVFKPLSLEDVQKIAQLMINKVARNLEAKGIKLEITPTALADLASQGFDPQFGARPLRRLIQEKIQDPLANYLLANKIERRDTVLVETVGSLKVIKAKEI
ncbi:MAG: AAA family ATPase [Patescibacteria group bacterium]|jgi:ATP-dependent Clp protease ATP-binding subunit ClpC|nr:AAA family ATPase [Patescibacteria group bacterium]